MDTVMFFLILICIVMFTPLIADLIVQWRQTRIWKTQALVSLSYIALFDGPDLEAGPESANSTHCLFLHPFEIGDDGLHHHHSFNGCSFCKKWFRPDKDVFFYSDMRFCSQECRFERIEMDQTKEKERMKNEKLRNGRWFKLWFW